MVKRERSVDSANGSSWAFHFGAFGIVMAALYGVGCSSRGEGGGASSGAGRGGSAAASLGGAGNGLGGRAAESTGGSDATAGSVSAGQSGENGGVANIGGSAGTGGSGVGINGGSVNVTGGTGAGSGGSGGGPAAGAGNGGKGGLAFVPTEGVTSVALSVNPSGVLLPMKLRNGTTSSTSITALGLMGDAFKLEPPLTFPRELAAGQELELLIRFAPSTSATATFEAKLSATSVAGMATANLFGLAMNAQNNEATFAQVVQTLGYKVNVGSTTLTLGTGSALVGEEVAAPRFIKAGNAPVGFQVVARYSPYEAAPYGFYTGNGPNVTRTQLGVMSKGPADNVTNRTLAPALDAGAKSSFDPGSEPFGIFAESASNTASIGADARFYQEDSLNSDQGNVQPVHRMRVYPLKDRSGTAVPNSYLVGCEEASNSDFQDYVFVISGVSIKN